MDKVTCIAFIMYQSSQNQEVKEIAIRLLNGDISMLELKKDPTTQPIITNAEQIVKKLKINRQLLQRFAEEFMMVEA
ncbi:MAG: hypothetical protein Q8906_15030 [Bacillota bacterium]|nr:hypothetical protein [Bacillota bacterium]MDP4171920.1 hypothetical protein [Bacillota bacterium]